MQRISVHQFFIVLASVFLGTTFFPIAQVVVREAGRAGWLAVFPGLALGLPLLFLILSLAKRFPGKNLLQITDQLLGKWIGKAIGLGFTLTSIYFGSLLLLQISDTWERTIQPDTTSLIHLGGAIMLVVVLSWVGIEVYARFTEVVFPLVVFTLLITLGFSIPRFEWDQYRPFFENGIMPLVWASLKIAPYTIEPALFIAGLMAFLPQERRELNRLKNGVWLSFALVGALNTLVAWVQIMVFGPVEAERLNYGILVLGSMVQVARSVAGVESLFMIIWLGASLIKVGAFFYMGMWGLRHVLGLKESLKWYIVLGTVFLSPWFIGFNYNLISAELAVMDLYVLLPFAGIWIPLVWGVDYVKRKWKR